MRSGAGRLAALGALLLAASPLAAQHPNHTSGFDARGTFELGDLESVNLWNGSPTLTLPLGGSYPVGPGLSLGMTLTYTGNLWEWDEVCPHYPDTTTCYLQAEPRRRSNSGAGWELTLGRILTAFDVSNTSPLPLYESPDQALHQLGSSTEPSVTLDGTYLRYRPGAAAVDSASGIVRTFDSEGRLTRLEDAFGNGFDVTYPTSATYGAPIEDWLLTDDHGRSHRVYFRPAPYYDSVVERVELAAFGGTTAPYDFTYSQPFVPRGCNDPITAGDTGNVQLPLLTRVDLPDGTAYEMPVGYYHIDGSASCPGRSINGHLERLDLPQGGALEWDWTIWAFPLASKHLGPLEGG